MRGKFGTVPLTLNHRRIASGDVVIAYRPHIGWPSPAIAYRRPQSGAGARLADRVAFEAEGQQSAPHTRRHVARLARGNQPKAGR